MVKKTQTESDQRTAAFLSIRVDQYLRPQLSEVPVLFERFPRWLTQMLTTGG